jgi:hypothetical protein
MTAIMIHEAQSREIDPLLAAGKLNRLANRPEILPNIYPGADMLDLTPLALEPHTFIAFYDDCNAGLFFPHGRSMQWEGHFLFGTLRGKAARALGQWCCSALFDYTPALAIVGQVPLENKAARIMARAIGCRPVGRSVDLLGRACTRYLLERGNG